MWGHLKLIDLFSTVNDKCVSQVRLGREEINMLKKVKSKRLKLSYIKQHLKSCVIMTNQCSFLSHCIDGLFYDVPVKFEFLLDTRRGRPVNLSLRRRPSGGGGFVLTSRRRFRPLQPQLLFSTAIGRQPSKKQNKSRQKPGYVRKEFAETWLWSEELVK